MRTAANDILLALLCWYETFSQGDTTQDILCTDTLTCNEHHRVWWIQMRAHVNNILQFIDNSRFDNPWSRIFDNNPFEHSLKMRNLLCKDDHSMGFMIDTQSDRWPIRCLWTGNDMNGTCAPAPPNNSSIFYIAPNIWRQKIQLGELYACKERCVQAGIGYLPSMFIMTALLVSFTLALLT